MNASVGPSYNSSLLFELLDHLADPKSFCVGFGHDHRSDMFS